jgi:hypothetical protein
MSSSPISVGSAIYRIGTPADRLKRVYFHRDYHDFQGGHLKVWDYFNHVDAAEGYRAEIYFTPQSVWGDHIKQDAPSNRSWRGSMAQFRIDTATNSIVPLTLREFGDLALRSVSTFKSGSLSSRRALAKSFW